MPIIKESLKIFSFIKDDFSKNKGLWAWLLIIWLLACILTCVGLGELPLRDFDEGTVARVAFELSHQKGSDQLFPKIWGVNYLNKPPGIHWLISKFIAFSNGHSGSLRELPTEFQIRLIPALISTFVIPLGGLIQLSLRPKDRVASIATSVILLTLLPIARHGRLAMLDGPMLSAMALLWLLMVSCNGTSNDRWRLLGSGLASSCMLLMKAPFLLPAAVAVLLPIIFENRSKNFFTFTSIAWLSIGLTPGVLWHIANFFQRGSEALWLWWGDGAGRVLFISGSGSDLGWRVPFIELLEGGWPWLLLLPTGLTWAIFARKTRWGLWNLCFLGVLCCSIFPLKTQLPWYSHSLWLPISILCGRPLSWLVHRAYSKQVSGRDFLLWIPILWIFLGLIVACLGLLGILNIWQFFNPYGLIALSSGIGWFVGGILLLNQFKVQRFFGLLTVGTGSFLALLILMSSQLWLWELNENWSVKPAAEFLSRTNVSPLALDEDFERPSLSWYAQKRIRTLDEFPNANWIITRNPNNFDLLTNDRECKIFDKDKSWALVFCSP